MLIIQIMASHSYGDGICNSSNVYSTKFLSHSIALTFWRGNIGNGSANSGGTQRVSALVTKNNVYQRKTLMILN